MIPRLRPIVTACVRSLAPSFAMMLRTWVFAVSSLNDSRAAIALLELPSATKVKHFDFAGGQRGICHVIRQLGGHIRLNSFSVPDAQL